MLIRRHPGAWNQWFAVGQLLLVAGLLGSRFVNPSSDLWAGFTDGFFLTLLVTSAFFNLRGMVLRRRGRS
jgi:hypothetical protein